MHDYNEALRLIAKGLSIRTTAEKLNIPRTTLQDYIKKHSNEYNKTEGVYKVIVLPDPHVPHFDPRTMNALEQFLSDYRVDEWLCLGDLCDWDFLFKLDRTYLKTIPSHTFAAQYEETNNWLDKQQTLVRNLNPQAKFTIIEGNHDIRPYNYMDVYPETRGILEPEKNLRFAERQIKYIKQWSKGEVYKIGKACFIHGHTVVKFHASVTAAAFGCNVFYGHTHDVQCHSIVKMGDNDTIVGQSFGCLQDYNAPYLNGRPTKWQQAFGLFWFFDDGHFTYSVIRVIDGAFVGPNGKIYRSVVE